MYSGRGSINAVLGLNNGVVLGCSVMLSGTCVVLRFWGAFRYLCCYQVLRLFSYCKTVSDSGIALRFCCYTYVLGLYLK